MRAGKAPSTDDLQLPRLGGAWWRGQVHCPFCLRLIETTPLGLSTLLGPSLLRCRTCGRLLISHRREWRDRNTAGKVWYVAVSLLHVAGCAALAFACTFGACAIAPTPAAWFPALAAFLWGTAVVALQAFRVARSLRRTRSEERAAHRPSFWSLDFFLPQKVGVAVALSSAVLAELAVLAARP